MSLHAAQVADALLSNVDRVVRGKRDEIRLALCCLLTEGHLLLDDVPGTGKTSLAKAIANSISGHLEAGAVHPRPPARPTSPA